MDLTRLAIISQKEFSDHITSKKLILILIIFCLILAVETANGVASYNEALEKYANGDSTEIYQPTAVRVFLGIVNAIGVDGLGIVIGLAFGFDLVSGEREDRSLKTILSQPLYRDELINGKAIGGIVALTLITLAGFAIVFAVMLILGIVPNINEIFGIGIIWFLTLLLIITSFSLSLMTSVIANTSSGSLILALVIIFITLLVIPVGGGALGTYILFGSPPEEPTSNLVSYAEYTSYQEMQADYNKVSETVQDFCNFFSIRSVYEEITIPITSPSSYIIEKVGLGEFFSNPDSAKSVGEPTFWTIIKDKWIKVIVFITWPVLFFGIAYLRFMRSDLR
ncbi:ABC transporter permease [Methanolacinia paynteri]|uniref:ABC transporter permease n=1 Tax=Methanolacinia paynteri TaxID=230356 RepID=UPI00064F2A5A|nr:ABC transporter permease subunit [Methanolacinia paynteri]